MIFINIASMKTLTIINAVFCTLNILLFFAYDGLGFGKAEVGFIAVVFGLWCLAFAISSLVFHFKREKTA